MDSRSTLQRGAPLRRSRRQMSAAEKAALDAFTDITLYGFEDEANPCLFSVTRPDHVCDGPMDAHHLIEKQYLRDHFSHLPEDELLLIVYDARIGAPLCRFNAHGPVTAHTDYVYLHELPLAATDFAADHGIVHRLERECPVRKRSA